MRRLQHSGFRCPIWVTAAAVSAASTFLLVGCGSGGGGGTSGAASALTGATSRAALNVYVTDGFSDRYKQVITTLYKIELTSDGTNYTTVFENTDGQTLDLSSLSDTALLVSSLSVASGTYTQARITFADHFTLVSPGGSTSESVAVDGSVGTQTGEQVSLVVATPVKAQAGTSATLLVDFKLADFALTGTGKLQPKLALGGEAECAGKNRKGTLVGTVANLTDTGFDLSGPNGHTVAVTLSDATVIMDATTGATGTLANGQAVEVQGTPDASSKTLAAASITTGVTALPKRQGADGTIASLGTDGATFVLTVERAGGLMLDKGGSITVQTGSTTKFLAGRRQTGAFSDLVVGGKVHVGGTYDATTQTLTATTVGLHPGEPVSSGSTDNHPKPGDGAAEPTELAQNGK